MSGPDLRVGPGPDPLTSLSSSGMHRINVTLIVLGLILFYFIFMYSSSPSPQEIGRCERALGQALVLPLIVAINNSAAALLTSVSYTV